LLAGTNEITVVVSSLLVEDPPHDARAGDATRVNPTMMGSIRFLFIPPRVSGSPAIHIIE
jgi:hypothetical protein